MTLLVIVRTEFRLGCLLRTFPWLVLTFLLRPCLRNLGIILQNIGFRTLLLLLHLGITVVLFASHHLLHLHCCYYHHPPLHLCPGVFGRDCHFLLLHHLNHLLLLVLFRCENLLVLVDYYYCYCLDLDLGLDRWNCCRCWSCR